MPIYEVKWEVRTLVEYVIQVEAADEDAASDMLGSIDIDTAEIVTFDEDCSVEYITEVVAT